MTDAKIIKALECCADEYIHSCDYCPFEKECSGDNLNLVKFALDLINRQKAEISVLRKLLDKAETEMNNQSENIKKLTADCYSMQSTLAKMSMGVEQAKAEAIKEFAEKVDEITVHTIDDDYMVWKSKFDNLVKEMAGDAE